MPVPSQPLNSACNSTVSLLLVSLVSFSFSSSFSSTFFSLSLVSLCFLLAVRVENLTLTHQRQHTTLQFLLITKVNSWSLLLSSSLLPSLFSLSLVFISLHLSLLLSIYLLLVCFFFWHSVSTIAHTPCS